MEKQVLPQFRRPCNVQCESTGVDNSYWMNYIALVRRHKHINGEFNPEINVISMILILPVYGVAIPQEIYYTECFEIVSFNNRIEDSNWMLIDLMLLN